MNSNEEIDNPFDRKIRFKTGVVRIGRPYRFEKPLSELAYNFIASFGISSLIIFVITDLIGAEFWVVTAIFGVIYLIAAYWVHPKQTMTPWQMSRKSSHTEYRKTVYQAHVGGRANRNGLCKPLMRGVTCHQK